MEDLTLKLGLLMEAAQAQQALTASALDRLREHTTGLDAIVREEIRNTLIEELQCLGEDSRRAAQALRGLQRTASRRALLWGAGIVTLATAVPCGVAWWMLPAPADIAALRATRDELRANIARLGERGGRVELRRCGAAQRLCVRVDRGAPLYGESADYLVVKGY